MRKKLLVTLLCMLTSLGVLSGCGGSENKSVATTVDNLPVDEGVIVTEDTKALVENEVIPTYIKYIQSEQAESGETFEEPVYYSVIYLDDDSIPELCISYGDGSSYYNWLLTYKDGEVNRLAAGMSFDFIYQEKTGYYYIRGWNTDNYMQLINGEASLVALRYMHQRTSKDDPIISDYYIGENEVTEEEYTLCINSIRPNLVSPEMYGSIQEAYENLGKITFSKEGGYITKFEMSGNVLTVETEQGESISYPVSDNCVWEATSFEGAYDTYTYESLKEKMDFERSRYLNYPDAYESPTKLFVEIKDEVIVKIYTFSA